MITTEWINVEEIIGAASVEINLEENLELETLKKFKETCEDTHSFFFWVSELPLLAEVADFQFLFENAITEHISYRGGDIPLFILFNQFKLYC